MKPERVTVHFECCGKEKIVDGKFTGQHAEYRLTCDVCGKDGDYAHDINAEDEPTDEDIGDDGQVHIYLSGCTDPNCKCVDGISHKGE